MQPTPSGTLPLSHGLAADGGPAARAASAYTFATRQVAQILGIGEATVKRLADAGKLEALRQGRARRFPAERIARFLRAGDEGGSTGTAPVGGAFSEAFVSAVLAGKIDLALAALIAALASGWALVRALEELVEPALTLAAADWFLELLARVPPLVPEGGRPQSVLVWSASGRTAQAGSVSCLLRGHGFEVLTPADWLCEGEIAELAARSGASYSILVSSGPDELPAKAAGLAAQLARNCQEGSVVLYGTARVGAGAIPPAVRRARSIREVASLVAHSEPG